ncbi:hypothetical protein TNCV_2894801 [Trichonephila clavipes]|nr:hypothetical protein TNCV_2894801 [Trichonephila clavipes]
MSLDLSSMSLDLSSMSLTCPACHWTPVLKLFLGDLCFIGPVQHVIDLSSISLTPVLKLFLGDLCFIGPVQHVILPVQHVMGPPC